MSSRSISPSFWNGRRVLLTGHTGFKGSWLTLWLRQMGAEVTGLSLAPASRPALFDVARVADGILDLRGDIRDASVVQAAVARAEPEVVFHMAAQALVRESYARPVETYATNVMGTIHVLEALRQSPSVRVAVVVTSDKCYLNDASGRAYRESDPLGGFDPYSSSKASTELVAAAWRNSFLGAKGVAVGSARAGNVIGGGDWADDRIVPDLVRAWSTGSVVRLRNPRATRPWQHVLAPLSGYLALAEAMWNKSSFADAWNFGPAAGMVQTVQQVVERAAMTWGEAARWEADAGNHPHEAPVLALDSGRAAEHLGFRSPWGFERSVDETVAWYRAHLGGVDIRDYTLSQISTYAREFG